MLEFGRRWWARQDSNPQPSRYERPALTIELQAPSHVLRDLRRAARVSLALRNRQGGQPIFDRAIFN